MNELLYKLKRLALSSLMKLTTEVKGLTSMVMKSTFILFFTLVAFIGVLGAIILILTKLIQEYNSHESMIASGYNYFYIPLLLFIGFCRWQFESLKSDLSLSPKPSKTGLIIAMITLVPAIFAFFSNLYSIYFGGATSSGSESNLFAAVFDSITKAGLVYAIVIAAIIIVFRLGIFTSGLSISIAVHNYLNGHGFDLSIFWDLLDLSLSDFWGAVFTIGNLLITYLIGKKLHIPE